MRARWLAAAFLLALAAPLAEALVPRLELARGSFTALAFLPWLVVAPLPRDANSGASPGELAFVLALALPTLALGAGLDLARGAAPPALLFAAGSTLVVLTLWCAAAELAAGRRAARTAFAGAWLVLLPGLGVLRFALSFTPRRGPADAAGGALAFALDPFVLCHRWGRAGGLEEPSRADAGVAVLAALLVFALVLGLRRQGAARA